MFFHPVAQSNHALLLLGAARDRTLTLSRPNCMERLGTGGARQNVPHHPCDKACFMRTMPTRKSADGCPEADANCTMLEDTLVMIMLGVAMSYLMSCFRSSFSAHYTRHPSAAATDRNNEASPPLHPSQPFPLLDHWSQTLPVGRGEKTPTPKTTSRIGTLLRTPGRITARSLLVYFTTKVPLVRLSRVLNTPRTLPY